MTGVAILVIVKNPDAAEQGRILIHDFGDGLDRKQTLDSIKPFSSNAGIGTTDQRPRIIPDEHGDWLDQRDSSFEEFLKVGEKKDRTGDRLFENCSLGVVTNSDPWCINSSKMALDENIRSAIDFNNEQAKRWQIAKNVPESTRKSLPKVDELIDNDTTRISWTRSLKQDIQKGKDLKLRDGLFIPCLYRPLTKL